LSKITFPPLVIIGLIILEMLMVPEVAAAGLLEGKISIVIVYDNYQINPHLTTRWGFGCVIRTRTKGVLFDTGGDSSILLFNMIRMNIDPKDLDKGVVSHIHHDHVGGLNGFL